MFDFDDLQTFVAVADAGGVSPAARRLGLSKSIISRRLAKLEADLGVQLLARTTRGAALTEAGLTFRDHAMRVTAEIDAARETLSPDGELRGRIRIAAPLPFGERRLAPLLTELARRHPRLVIHTSYSDRYVDLVREGFDVAIRIGILPDSTLIARRIGPVRARLVATPAYIAEHGAPQTLEEIGAHEAVTQEGEIWRFQSGGRVVSVHPRRRFTADAGQPLVDAALAGLGISMLPDFLIEQHIASGALVTILADFPVPEAGLYVVRPPGSHPTRAIRVLTDMLVEHLSGQCTAGAPSASQV